MDNDDSYNWQQGSWASDWFQASNTQDAQQNGAPYEHPAFADAERIARAARVAFLRSQLQMRSAQNDGRYQHGINQVMSQSPISYHSPYFQGQERPQDQRGSQPSRRQQGPHTSQLQQWQQYMRNQQHRQDVRPSDMDSSRSPHQSNIATRVSGHTTAAGPSQFSVPAEMATSHARGGQGPSMQQAARPVTSSLKPDVPAPNNLPTHHLMPESRSQTTAQASSMQPPMPNATNATVGTGRYGAPFPRTSPAVSLSQSSKSTPAAPVTSAPSARAPVQTSRGDAPIRQPPSAPSASLGSHNPPLPQEFLPHISLRAPTPTGRGRGLPPKYVVDILSSLDHPSALFSAKSTHNGRVDVPAGSSSNTIPASQPLISERARAAGIAAPYLSAAQSQPTLPPHVEKSDFLKGRHAVQETRSRNWHVPSGLPVPPTTLGPASIPTNPQQRPAMSNAPGPSYQPGTQTVQQPPMHGHGQGQPPPKIRRMQDGTKQAIAPPTASPHVQYARLCLPPGPRVVSKIQEADLVQPLDPREAEWKKAYDPTTIARDVLITANKHPTEKYLNHHLEILRSSFGAVTFTSDLSTFRWDLVEFDAMTRDSTLHRPGQPTRPEARPAYHYHQPTGPSALGSLPFKSPAYQPRSAPAPAPAPTIASPTSYLPRSAVGPRVGPFSSPAPCPAPQTPPVVDLTSKPTPKAPPATVPPPTSTPAPTTAPPPTPAPSTALTPVHPATPSRTIPVSQSPRPKPKQAQKSPAKAPSQSPRNKAYPQPKVVIATSPETMPPEKRKPGRPKRTAKTVEVAIHNEPSVPYPVFHCKWTNCQSELHNMRALQSHVLKGHVPHDINCGWEGCTDKAPMAAQKMWIHVREKHIEPMAWALGDGPSVPAPADSEALITRSRFKRSGRHQRRGTIIWPVNQTSIEAYSRVYGLRHPKQKAEALKEGGVHWKEGVGCELDQSARRLSSPAKQALSVNREVAYSIEKDSA